jgi:hemoglobin/transferrin/lactoferrin receptor protein
MSKNTFTPKKAILPLIISQLLYVDAALAAEKSMQDLDSIVVVGQTTNTEITSKDLELQQANDLADVFRHVPSVSVGGSLGVAQKVYIRGLEDTLLNITVDGAPQTGTVFPMPVEFLLILNYLKK